MSVLVALVVVLGGAILAIPGVVAIGVAALGLSITRTAWLRYGARTVTYRRRLATDRAVVGDEIELEIAVRNGGPLPLPWVRTVDGLGRGVSVAGPPEAAGSAVHGELVNGWTLGPFELVSRRFRILATRRGVFELGPLTIAAGDLLGRSLPIEEASLRTRYLVRPRMVAVHGLDDTRDRGGERRARTGLAEDPSRFAGVRPYRPGDPLRHLHRRATARTGRPLTKRFDPSRRRDVVLVLDLRAPGGPGVGATERDEATEGLIVAAMSLARSLHGDGAAVGLAVAGFAGGARHILLPPNGTAAALGLLADLLARLDAIPSLSFSQLLDDVSRRLSPGTTIVTMSAVDPGPALVALRRLSRSGFGVIHIAFGRDAPALASRATAVGIAARAARLDGPWATSTRLEFVA
ncbi:MAG: DUF58 domain-containing protein [Chloroflexi bacterium]|nr:DUF58 domain-containing protein [Chloroflexota bacterium]